MTDSTLNIVYPADSGLNAIGTQSHVWIEFEEADEFRRRKPAEVVEAAIQDVRDAATGEVKKAVRFKWKDGIDRYLERR